MKLSFVIPAYNEEAQLAPCLQSICAAVGSSRDLEIIVVNNASTDRTRDVALSFPGVRVVDEPLKGLVRARQAGYLASRGDLIANVDADTILPEGWLATVEREFARRDDLVALSGPFIFLDLPLFQRTLVRVFYGLGYGVAVAGRLLGGSGAMIQGGNFVLKRTALDRIGGFDTSIEFYGEDTDVGMRIGKIGRVKWTFGLPMFASGRRLREEGITRMALRYAVNFLAVTFRGKPYTKEYVDVREQ